MATVYRSGHNKGTASEEDRFLIRTANVIRLVKAEDDFNGAKERMLEAGERGETWTEAFYWCVMRMYFLRSDREGIDNFQKTHEFIEVTREELNFKIDIDAIKATIADYEKDGVEEE